jgi:fimbrial chaperone protein
MIFSALFRLSAWSRQLYIAPFLFLSVHFSVAHADLLVTPTRLDLNDKARSGNLTLVSQAREPVVYRIGWVRFSMQPDGSYTETAEPRADAKKLEELVRFSPRQVTLGPGETQVVRVSLPRGKALPEGELRSHLILRADPIPYAKSDAGSEGIAVNLSIAKGVAVPVVLRSGGLEVSAKLMEPRIIKRPDGQLISVVIQRAGTISPYGEVEILGRVDGKEVSLGVLKGVAVFLEIEKRTVLVPISDSTALARAKDVRILYHETSPSGQRSKVFAEVALP